MVGSIQYANGTVSSIRPEGLKTAEVINSQFVLDTLS